MSKDDFITLPMGIDFRKPGQLSPWEAKERRERNAEARNALFRGASELAAQQAMQNAALMQGYAQHATSGDQFRFWPFQGIGQ